MKDLQLGAYKGKRSQVQIEDTHIGSDEIILMGGPCAVESEAQMDAAAAAVQAAGGRVLRGGVFKPRTSPYSFQGLGKEGLRYLVQAGRAHGLLTVTEAIDPASLELVVNEVDIVQIGARNMQNFQLLKLAGQLPKPVILKRGLAATVEEWLLAAEYILAEGNSQVILCERGIRTFEPSTRNTLDLSAVAVAKGLTHLPVIVDPSHAAGRRDLVPALAQAAVVAGADGLLIEMHPHPEEAESDGPQSLTPEQLYHLAEDLRKVAGSVGRTVNHPSHHSLPGLRREIDGIDRKIIELLAHRMSVVDQIAAQKSLDKIRDSNREKEVLHRLRDIAATLNCPADLVEKIYAQIFDYAVQLQLKTKLNKEPKSLAYFR